MITKLLFCALLLAAPLHLFAQHQDSEHANAKEPVHHAVPGTVPDAAAPVGSDPADAPVRVPSAAPEPDSAPAPAKRQDYVRPDRDERFRRYVNNLAGPVALISYVSTAGLLTARNSPYEWGTKPDGFGKRLANVVGKGVIRSTTVYGLDELLKVDSTFYRSRDRRVLARMRNCVFSTVTARNRRGERVFGLPNIAGGLTSEVISSSGWYPPRYDYVHGLKGGAIQLGINAGVNLFKEFVWK